MHDDTSSSISLLPVYSPTYPPENTTVTTSMPLSKPQKPPDSSSAKGIARLTVHIPSTFRQKLPSSVVSPSRWSTAEYKFYYVAALFVIPAMIWIPMTLSLPSHPNYSRYSQKLSEGWIYNRLVDNSDPQYRSFRNNLPILCKAAFGFLTIKFMAVRCLTNPLHLIPVNSLLSLVMIVALHGSSAFKLLLILTLNYLIAKRCRGLWVSPVLTWTFNGFVLFTNDFYHGYQFSSLGSSLSFLDGITGLYPRWHVIYNITMLRLISFNMDYYWACKNPENVEQDLQKLTEKQRVTVPHGAEHYSALNYVAYVLYPPLYIAGPIMTFNDFMWQHRSPLGIQSDMKIKYLIRLVVCYLTMEYILHFMYVVAIKDTNSWIGDSPSEIGMIGFWNLMVVWLKLLIPWRFFRAWALLDGIDPPENMVRCMANNYSTFGFWRSWHRSYNLWVIRYIYVPIGGSKNVILNTLLVFSFVALWHDLTFRLLAWGWLVSLFVIPELAASYLLPASKYGKYSWYRHVCAVGGVLNLMMMMFANLVGFVVGTDDITFLASQLFGTWDGARFMVLATICLFMAVMLMFEYREEELRQGIQRRC